jgi:hypothetical protein
MKRIKWVLFLIFAILCFTGGILVDRALVGPGEAAANPAESLKEDRPVCKNVLRPNFVLPSDGLFFNSAYDKPITRSKAEELFQQALETTNFNKRAELLRQVAMGIPKDDLQEALEWVEQIPLGEDRNFFQADLLARWAKEDIASALAYADDLKGIGQRNMALANVVGVWVRHDVDAALAWVLEQPDGQVRTQTLQTAIWQVTATDPARAADLAGELNPIQGDYQMGAIYRQWAVQDPEVAAQKAGQLPQGQGRFMALNSVAAAWGENDVDAALSWIKSLDKGPETEGLISAAIVSHATMQKDPKRALELAMQEGSDQTARSVLLGISYQLTPEDFDETMDWAQALPSGQFRDEAIQTLGWQLSINDPQKAIELADTFSNDTARNSFVLQAVSQWGRTDPQKAAAYVEGMSEGDMRTSALDGLIANWAYQDPAKAAEFAERNCRGEEMGRVAGVLVSNWGYKDPEAAADWLGRNADEVQPYVVENLVASWLGSGQEGSRDQVTAWVDSLPTGKMRDHAMLSLGGSMTYENPQDAWSWAEQIENDELRESAMFEIVDNWMMQDEEAAREWIDRVNLDDDFKKELLEDPESLGACRCECPC